MYRVCSKYALYENVEDIPYEEVEQLDREEAIKAFEKWKDKQDKTAY